MKKIKNTKRKYNKIKVKQNNSSDYGFLISNAVNHYPSGIQDNLWLGVQISRTIVQQRIWHYFHQYF